MDKFEELIKTSAESYEAPYSEAAWDALSKKLGPEKGLGAKWYIGGAIVAASIVLGIWYLAPSTEVDTNSSEAIVLNDINFESEIEIVSENAIAVEEITSTVIDKEEEVKNEVNISEPKSQSQTNNIQSQKPITQLDDEHIANTSNIDYSNLAPITSDNIEPETENPQKNAELIAAEIDFSKFNLSAVANKSEICIGQSISFSPSIPKLKAAYQWDLGNGDIVSGPYLDYQFEQAGVYNVSVQLVDSKTRKLVNKSEPITITVNALPHNEISYEFNDNALLPRANFKQKNTDVKEISWKIKGLHQSNEQSFSYDFKYKGSYIIICNLTDKQGCKSVSNVLVPIENDYNLLAPSAFTPNGDNLNETFIPKALLVSNTPFIMTIYDKSGKLVFETNDASRPWDGLYKKDFLPAPTGSYVWVVQLTTEQNKTETYQGQVTITR
ncbi:MAG: gliding motility-associated C-terminal domain-containing protein [Crocinitomicaceae bacterium]